MLLSTKRVTLSVFVIIPRASYEYFARMQLTKTAARDQKRGRNTLRRQLYSEYVVLERTRRTYDTAWLVKLTTAVQLGRARINGWEVSRQAMLLSTKWVTAVAVFIILPRANYD